MTRRAAAGQGSAIVSGAAIGGPRRLNTSTARRRSGSVLKAARSCAAVLWWSTAPCAIATLRRLHLAAQAGGTPLVALRRPVVRDAGSPAPLRAACSAESDRRLAVEVFKRRGPPMAAPLAIALPWPAAARRVVPPAVRTPAGRGPSVAPMHAEARGAAAGAVAALRPAAPQSVERV